jgi:hypothetical protein
MFVGVDVQSQEFSFLAEDDSYSPYQSNLPKEVQFLVNDEFQKILFNPAAGAWIESTQFFTTIVPNSSSIRLVGILPKKWVFQFSYRDYITTNRLNNEYSRTTTELSTNGDSRRETDTEFFMIEDFESRIASEFSEFKVSKLLKSSEQKARALSLYVGFSGNESLSSGQTDRNDRSDTNQYFADTLGITGYQVSVTDLTNDNDSYLNKWRVGLEYSLVSEDVNMKHELSMQATFLENENIENKLSTIDRFTNEIVNDRTITSETRLSTISSNMREIIPIGIGYRGFLSKALNRFGNDFVLISLAGNYSLGESMLVRNNSTLNRQEVNDTVENVSEGSSVYRNKLDEYLVDIQSRIGYTIKFSESDLDFFTGIVSFVNFQDLETHRVSNNRSIDRVNETVWSTGVYIPVFAELALNDWVQIFGGATLTSSYEKESLEAKPIDESAYDQVRRDADIYTYSDLTVTTTDRVNTISQLTQRSFFGLKAHHKSGLRLIADINGDIARLGGWNITIGYAF